MKKFDGLANKSTEATDDHLDLPVEPDFVSRNLPIHPELILKRSEENLPNRNTSEMLLRRFEEKADVEFRLF